MTDFFRKDYRLFEDIFDEIGVEEKPEDVIQQVSDEELMNSKEDLSQTNVDGFKYKFKFEIKGIKKHTGKAAVNKTIDEYKKFNNMLKYIFDMNRYVDEYSDIIFNYYVWNNKENTHIEHVGDLLIHNTPDELPLFFNSRTVIFTVGFNSRSITTPKAVYNLIKSIYNSINIALKRVWGSKAYLSVFYDKSNGHTHSYMSNGTTDSIIAKESKTRETFLTWVRNFTGDSQRYEAIQFYEGSDMSQEVYEFYRYAGILSSDIKKRFDEKNKILYIDITNCKWTCKKDVGRLINKASTIGYKLKICGTGSINIVVNGFGDIKKYESILEFPMKDIVINIPGYDVSGWKGLKTVDLTKWKVIHSFMIYPKLEYRYWADRDKIPVYPVFKIDKEEIDLNKRYH